MLGVPLYRTFIMVEPLIGVKVQNENKSLEKIEILLDIIWQRSIQGADFHGQLGQDLVAYSILRDKIDTGVMGFYVDIAAHDGININNTYMFENLGWQGFCVEANPKTFEVLRKNRKCDCYNVAVFSQNIGKARFAFTAASTLDTLEITMSAEHKDRMQRESRQDVEYVDVETTTFDELMSHYPHVRHIDFLSLDVEGGELEVLKGIDFSRYTFGVMTIEHNGVNDTKREITKLLHKNGYRILFNNGWDFMFVRDSRVMF